MKKVVRLTESDLVRLVKKVIKENKFDMDMDMDFSCDEIMDKMENFYNDFIRYYDKKNNVSSMQTMKYSLSDKLESLVRMAYDMNCYNLPEIEEFYDELLYAIEKKTERNF